MAKLLLYAKKEKNVEEISHRHFPAVAIGDACIIPPSVDACDLVSYLDLM